MNWPLLSASAFPGIDPGVLSRPLLWPLGIDHFQVAVAEGRCLVPMF